MTQPSPMLYENSPAAAQFWRRRATVLALRLNFHHWLTRIVPKLFFLFVFIALFDLFRRETALPAYWIEGCFFAGLGVVSVWAWLGARNHFCTGEQALVRLETILGLHNQLSSAQDGMLPWPKPQALQARK